MDGTCLLTLRSFRTSETLTPETSRLLLLRTRIFALINSLPWCVDGSRLVQNSRLVPSALPRSTMRSTVPSAACFIAMLVCFSVPADQGPFLQSVHLSAILIGSFSDRTPTTPSTDMFAMARKSYLMAAVLPMAQDEGRPAGRSNENGNLVLPL